MRKAFIPAMAGAMLLLSLAVSGCSQDSYPPEKIKQSLLEICEKEYGINDIDVKIVGKTIGVFLPLPKLFAADFKEAAVTGKVRNLDTLFEPSPEALEKVEDVLFSISRILLSTSKPLDFYTLQATDVEKTGMQLILSGFVNDIKRVRVWDISRNEYRKRVIHELKLSRAVLWHRPIRRFFKDLGVIPFADIKTRYFAPGLSEETLQNLFAESVNEDGTPSGGVWQVLEMRSASVQRNEVLVYSRVMPPKTDKKENPVPLQYLFLVTFQGDSGQILRIIPFQYQDETGKIQRISFPKELQIEQNLEHWEEEFPMPEMHLGPFLAQQLTRRVQAIAASDERIQNTFRDFKISFEYQDIPDPHFDLNLEATLRDMNNYSRGSLMSHEDLIYLLGVASREFVDVLRSYQFGEFRYLQLNVAQESQQMILGRDALELFRRKRIDFQGLLSLPRL